MKTNPDEEFLKNYEASENESTEDFINRYSSTVEELRATISYLIEHREMLRNLEIEHLEEESQQLINKLHDLDRAKLLEELKCFKEVLALHKTLIQNNDKRD